MSTDTATTIELPEAQRLLGELVDRAAQGTERILVTREGEPVAALVSLEDLRWLEEVQDRLDSATIDAAITEWTRTGAPTRSLEDVAQELNVTLS